MDSVRFPFRGTAAEDELRPIAELQLFSEILVTIILGRQIAVPQSYAFDSYGFQKVAHTFLNARDEAGADADHPFRPHLFGDGIRGFDGAVTAMLTRATAGGFVSSAFPELAAEPPAGDDRPDAMWLLSRPWLDDERRAAFAAVRAEFAGLPPVPAGPRPDRPTLPTLLRTFAESEAPGEPGAFGDSEAPGDDGVHDRLVRSIRALGPELTERSSLRGTGPWPSDPRGRTAAEVAGGDDRLTEVIEFVDSLYNVVLAGSIGVATTTMSTGLETDDQRLAVRRIAQSLAVAQYQQHPAAPAGPAPMFEVREAGAAPDDIRRLYESASRGLPALFEERGAPRRSSPFWKGVDAVHHAPDAAAAQMALEQHLTHVAGLLGKDAHLGLRNRVLEFGLGLSVAAGSAWVGAACSMPVTAQIAIGLGSETLPTGLGFLATHLTSRSGTRRRAAALMQLVDLSA